jgi:hypothetical protein
MIKLLPQTGTGNYTPQGTNVIRIDIPPSVGFLDTQNSYLRFRIKVDDTGVEVRKPVYMDKNAMSWCERFEVISNNGSVLESIHDYNLLVNLLHKATSPDDYRLTAGKLLDNQGCRAERMANLATKQGREYCVGLDASGIFGGNTKYLPCQFVQGALTLEFTLAQFADCFVGQNPVDLAGNSLSSVGNYTISNVEYVAECISFGQDYNYLFEQQLRSSGIDISFHSYRSHHHSINNTSESNIQLAQNSKSVKGVYCVIRDKDRMRSKNHESLSEYKSGNLQQYQFDLGGRLFPEFPVSLTDHGEVSCYANNLNSFNHFRDQNGGAEVTRDHFQSSLQMDTVKPVTGGSDPHNNAPIRRFHGYLIGNTATGALATSFDMAGGQHADPFAASGDGGVLSTTIYFQPSNLFDLPDMKLGDRVKITLNTDVANEKEDDALTSYTGPDGYDETNKGREHAYLYVVGVGLDILVRQKAQSVDGQYGYSTRRGCVALAKTRLGQKSSGAACENAYLPLEVRGLQHGRSNSVEDVDEYSTAADNYGYFNPGACYLDVIPDDHDFYIGQSFETHEEHDSLISGTDLTNTVPLHVNLKFPASTKDMPNAPVTQGDLLTAFIHYDSVLRIEPDGSVISSM